MASRRPKVRFSRASATVLSAVSIALFSVTSNLHLLTDLGFGDDYEDAHLPFVTTRTVPSRKDDSFSACLLTMDDNHFLIEWLAYHYHVLPLRRLIVAVDPRSKTSPTFILNRWRQHGIAIDEWSDADYMQADTKKMAQDTLKSSRNMTDETRLYHLRQRFFYNECFKKIKAENRSWTMVLDPDEYLVLNSHHVSKTPTPSMKQAGSVLSVLQQTRNETGSSPCIMIPRLRFGAIESPVVGLGGIPTELNVSAFQTLSFQKHAALNDFRTNKIGKSIFDVSRIDAADMNVREPHRLVWDYCPESGLKRRNENSSFVIHHYLGTWEQYNFRDDVLKGVNQSRKAFDKLKGLNVGDDDSILPWLAGFIEEKGPSVAIELLEGVSDVQRWPLVKNGTKDQVATPKSAKRVTRQVNVIQKDSTTNQRNSLAVLQKLKSMAPKVLSIASNIAVDNSTLPDKDTFSACLLVMDDNHVLIEWLAYHYHVLPLRHVIVAVDPRSITSPSEILDRWREHGMTIEEWSDENFMSEKLYTVAQHLAELNSTQVIELHRARQREFYSKCMKRLKSQKRKWTLLTDTDEFLLINQRATKRFNVANVPPMDQPASVMTFLKQERAKPKNETEMPKGAACIMIPRLRFGSKESPLEKVNARVPDGFNASLFTTLRHRKHAQPRVSNINKTGKVIVDVSRLNPQKMTVKNPHRPLWAYCPRSELFTEIMDNLFVIHHYSGTWDQYSFREDFRPMKTRESFEEYNNRNLDDDAIRPWLHGFVEDKGVMAANLLKDVGKVPVKNSSAAS